MKLRIFTFNHSILYLRVVPFTNRLRLKDIVSESLSLLQTHPFGSPNYLELHEHGGEDFIKRRAFIIWHKFIQQVLLSMSSGAFPRQQGEETEEWVSGEG